MALRERAIDASGRVRRANLTKKILARVGLCVRGDAGSWKISARSDAVLNAGVAGTNRP